ncbi:MAG: inositol phosphorylceramide synthase [Bdellovibrionales bacterium]|nr:inositol phosphorylceramide synthase [Bdellovibrionales bacterium]
MDLGSNFPFKTKSKLLGLFIIAYGFFYIFPNLYARWDPALLPMTWLDNAIPLIPVTFLIYTSDYLLILFAIILIKNPDDFRSFSRMMFATLFTCGLFFIFFPTTYPRPSYPIVSNTFIKAAMEFIYVGDSPNNCLPSLHVALTSVATWSLRKRSKKLVGFLGLWTLAIIISTLTTKQHYFIDIIGGLLVLVAVAMGEKWFVNHFTVKHYPEISDGQNSKITKAY